MLVTCSMVGRRKISAASLTTVVTACQERRTVICCSVISQLNLSTVMVSMRFCATAAHGKSAPANDEGDKLLVFISDNKATHRGTRSRRARDEPGVHLPVRLIDGSMPRRLRKLWVVQLKIINWALCSFSKELIPYLCSGSNIKLPIIYLY